MWYPKEIFCPICSTKISKMGGGFAEHWGTDTCSTCGNLLDFDTEMLAESPKDVEESSSMDSECMTESVPKVSFLAEAVGVDELHERFVDAVKSDSMLKASEQAQQEKQTSLKKQVTGLSLDPAVIGEMDESFVDFMKNTSPTTPLIYSHHPSRESIESFFASVRQMRQPYVDYENRLKVLVDYYSEKQVDGLEFLSESVVERAKNDDLDIAELDILVACLSKEISSLQDELSQKDRLLSLYAKQEQTRKEYLANKPD